MTQHTPGPWVSRKAKHHYHIEANATGYGAAVALVEHVANATTGWTSEANARLIAAAPELLEAVQLWRQFFDDMPKGQFANISCDIGLMNDAFLKSRAAIAKATGKKG